MRVDSTKKRNAAIYDVSFADEEWEELPALSRCSLTAHELIEYVDQWNATHQALLRGTLRGYDLLAQAHFLTIEVDHGQS